MVDNKRLWQGVLGEAEIALSKANFSTWFKNTEIIDASETIAFIRVPNTFIKEWFEKKYEKEIIKKCLLRSLPHLQKIEYVIGIKSKTETIFNEPAKTKSVEPAPAPFFATIKTRGQGETAERLNPRYTFDNFVVGDSNKMAQAAAKSGADVFIVNPVTHRMLFKDAKEKSSFKKLPYPKNINAEKLYSDPEFRMEKIIKASVEYQIKRGASLVIAPYLFAEDTDDTKFVLNLTMLSETIKYLKDNKINLPLFAMIHIGSRAFTKTIIINSIIDRYREGFEDNIQGFIITVDELDDRKASEESLSGLAYMAFQLSKGHDVLVNSIGGFGEILSVLGCCGFISGLGTGETTSVKILQDTPRKIKGRSHEWTYIPEIFDYAHDSEVKKIGYKCSCSACNGAVPVDIPSKMRHFLFRKIEIMSALRNMNSRDRINFMKERIDKALDYFAEREKKSAEISNSPSPIVDPSL